MKRAIVTNFDLTAIGAVYQSDFNISRSLILTGYKDRNTVTKQKTQPFLLFAHHGHLLQNDPIR